MRADRGSGRAGKPVLRKAVTCSVCADFAHKARRIEAPTTRVYISPATDSMNRRSAASGENRMTKPIGRISASNTASVRSPTAAAAFRDPIGARGRDTSTVSIGRIGLPISTNANRTHSGCSRSSSSCAIRISASFFNPAESLDNRRLTRPLRMRLTTLERVHEVVEVGKPLLAVGFWR
jgi:hypothetical protein